MQIINIGKEYATITGGLLKTGSITTIEDWELPIMEKLGAKVEIVEASKTVETKTVKKKKK